MRQWERELRSTPSFENLSAHEKRAYIALVAERKYEETWAERDQLRQQVEKLLGQIDAHQKGAPLGEPNQALYELADQVRKELEGR